MDQKTIVEGLQKALANGSGTLDDLETLLNRAKQDIAQAKVDEQNAAKKRGQEIADLANRLLEGKTTDGDCAIVINAWLAAKGHKGKGFTAKDFAEIFETGENVKAEVNRAEKTINDLVNDINEWAKMFEKNQKPAAQPKPKEDPNDVIDDFLRSFGLR